MLPTKKTEIKTDLAHMNTLIYGLPKTGKSTFAAQIPHALFLACEEGLNFLSVFKVPFTKWEDAYELGKSLKTEKHEFKTLVIDTADLFYKHCEHYICKKNNVTHLSDLAYGKGHSLVKDEFSRVIHGFNQLGLGLVFISHAKEKELKKRSEVWTVMDSTLPSSASQIVCGLVDLILYAYIDHEGNRVIRTKPTKFINAGDRSGLLPELMKMDFLEVQKHLQAAPKADEPTTVKKKG